MKVRGRIVGALAAVAVWLVLLPATSVAVTVTVYGLLASSLALRVPVIRPLVVFSISPGGRGFVGLTLYVRVFVPVLSVPCRSRLTVWPSVYAWVPTLGRRLVSLTTQ